MKESEKKRGGEFGGEKKARGRVKDQDLRGEESVFMTLRQRRLEKTKAKTNVKD